MAMIPMPKHVQKKTFNKSDLIDDDSFTPSTSAWLQIGSVQPAFGVVYGYGFGAAGNALQFRGTAHIILKDTSSNVLNGKIKFARVDEDNSILNYFDELDTLNTALGATKLEDRVAVPFRTPAIQYPNKLAMLVKMDADTAIVKANCTVLLDCQEFRN